MVILGVSCLYLNVYINVIACDNRHVCLENLVYVEIKLTFYYLFHLWGFSEILAETL